jgi:hypothetical protein
MEDAAEPASKIERQGGIMSVIATRPFGGIKILSLLLCGVACMAQDTQTTTDSPPGQNSVKTEVRSAEVLYVSGNDVVVKLDAGEVKHFNVVEGFQFNIDGQKMTAHDLKPGMHLNRTITTSTTPKTVQSVRTINGKVWFVNPPETVILTLPDGTNKQYKVPDGQKFLIDGQEQSVFHLKKGMSLSATVITDSPIIVMPTTRSTVAGNAPPPVAPPETPAMAGALLIEEAPLKAKAPPAEAAAAEPVPGKLPKAAMSMPLVGLAGFLSLAAFAAFRIVRKRQPRPPIDSQNWIRL